MPGKVNPVIPEAVAQAAIAVMAHDQAIAQAASAGNLELNQFMPLIADALLTSLDLLTNACTILRARCVEGIEADEARCRRHVESGTAAATALIERLGYEGATDLARAARDEGKTIRQIVVERGLIAAEEFDEMVSPERVTRLGSRNEDAER
jgi:aspartate ammonia-lyase